jgi:hypothetical protein
MNKETNLQQIYREKALEHIKALCFALEVAEQDNLDDTVLHLVKIECLATQVNNDLSALSLLKCHRL